MNYLSVALLTYEQYGVVVVLRMFFSELYRIFVRQAIFGSYSQHGEDLIIAQLLRDKKIGLYVDIGAHEPMRNSNTYYFYRRGWRGICIDADPDCIQRLIRARPRDICVHTGVSNKDEKLLFYRMSAQALSTFSVDQAKQHELQGHKIVDTLVVQTSTLGTILNTHLPAGTQIDFLNVDVEGFDLAVLESNDWKKFLPRVICVESTNPDRGGASRQQDAIVSLLQQQGYTIFARTKVNTIYRL